MTVLICSHALKSANEIKKCNIKTYFVQLLTKLLQKSNAILSMEMLRCSANMASFVSSTACSTPFHPISCAPPSSPSILHHPPRAHHTSPTCKCHIYLQYIYNIYIVQDSQFSAICTTFPMFQKCVKRLKAFGVESLAITPI